MRDSLSGRFGLQLGLNTVRQAGGTITPTNPPINTVAPAVTPATNVIVGTTLATTNGTWLNTPAFTYQWLRDGVPINLATSVSYLVTMTDVNAVISCRITGSNADGSSSAISNSVGPVITIPLNTVAPVMTPTTDVTVGTVMSVTTGTWTSATSFAYQWLRSGVNISGATTNSYTIQTADDGAMISCRVTGSNIAGQTSAASNEVGPIITGIPPSSNEVIWRDQVVTWQGQTVTWR